MLNISKNSVATKIDNQAFSALRRVEAKVTGKVLIRVVRWFVLILIIIALLPWTQNVRTVGSRTDNLLQIDRQLLEISFVYKIFLFQNSICRIRR